MDETLRTVFMGIATLVAVFSFFNTTRLWRKANRPILSAFVETHSAGNVATMYNLLIINSGNRPAVNVCLDLKLSDEDFRKCITQEIDNSGVEAILKCFNVEGTIPLLIDGDKRSNYFGLTSSKSEDNIWRYGSSLPIEITYQDLEGEKYVSALNLVVKYSKAFAGMEWSDKTHKREDVVKLLKQILDSIQ
ncbi:MAG: hypothetical protein AAGF01_18895 [Cyanobacteria bacterium P01_G01_bin.38]